MSLGTMEQRTEGMKRQSQELIEQAYRRGFKAGREDRQEWEKDQADRLIEQGRNEAWEAVRKIMLSIKDGGMTSRELMSIFGVSTTIPEIFKNNTASEVIEKLKTYEEICIGDEVIADDRKFIVIGVENSGFRILWCFDNGLIYNHICTLEMKKTGRHFTEIVEVFKKLQESEG